jgi:hypothetical protein
MMTSLVETPVAPEKACVAGPFVFHIWHPKQGLLCGTPNYYALIRSDFVGKLAPEHLCDKCIMLALGVQPGNPV